MSEAGSEVVIVGSGPTGVTAANLLAGAGVDCRILSAEPEMRPVTESRAEGIHPRTIALLERLGVLSEVLARGRPLHRATLHSGGRVLGFMEMDDPLSYYPGALILSQGWVEQILAARLEKRGVVLERGWKLTALTQPAGRVRAVFRHGDGREQVVTARYLVGCDGAHSATRKLIGAVFAGKRSDIEYALADAQMRWRGEPLDDDLHLYLSPLTLLGRLESGTWKIAAPVPAGVTMTEDPSSVLAVLQAGVDRHGIGAELHSPRWTSRFRISTRRVDRMRVGNVFLAGDAAHLHSPVGGQGMNEGMQDAQNLAWKLALVLRGHVDESLLDSYDAEREPIIADVLADTSRMTRLVEMPEGVGATLRDKVIAAATRVAALQPLLREQFAGSYRDIRHSPLVAEDTPSVLDSLRAHFGGGTVRPNPSDAAVAFRGAARAGDRALDVDGIVADAQGTPFRLFASREDFFGHELLVFAGDVVDAKRVAALQDMARNIGVRHGGRVRAVVITKTPTAGAWHDSTGELHRRYGARYECLYLVRPDGFIAFRAQPATAEPLEAFLRERYGAGF